MAVSTDIVECYGWTINMLSDQEWYAHYHFEPGQDEL